MVWLHGQEYARGELLRRVGRLDQIAGVRLVTLGDGAARGVRVLEFRTGGGLAFDVLVDRGFDVGRCDHAGRALAFESGVGVQGPWYYEPDGLGFLRGFGGGLFTTAGLDHILFPAEDDASHFHYPPRATQRYPLHGRVANRPARLVAYGHRWDGDACTLYAEGEVEQAEMFGEQLILRRRIEAAVGGNRIRVRDHVINAGFTDVTHMHLYHINLGFPLVDEGADVLVPPFSERRALGDTDADGHLKVQGPTAALAEQVVEYRLTGSPAVAGILNDRRGIGLTVSFDAGALPYLFVWRMLGEGNYVVGLEPSTNSTAGRDAARESGELRFLAPGEGRTYEVAFDVAADADAVEALRSRRS